MDLIPDVLTSEQALAIMLLTFMVGCIVFAIINRRQERTIADLRRQLTTTEPTPQPRRHGLPGSKTPER